MGEATLGWPSHLSTHLLGPFDLIWVSRMTDENTNGRIVGNTGLRAGE